MQLLFDHCRGVETSHAAQNVDEIRQGKDFAIPGFPQVQNGLCWRRPRGKEGHVAMDVQPLREQPPVVSLRRRRIKELCQVRQHVAVEPEATGLGDEVVVAPAIAASRRARDRARRGHHCRHGARGGRLVEVTATRSTFF